MTDLAVAAGLVALAWLLTGWDRRDRRIAELEAELAAAETDLRTAGGNRRCHLTQAARRPAPVGPPDIDLAAWDAEVQGLPWGHACDQRPANVTEHIDADGHRVWRIVPERPSTAMVRRIAMETAA